MHSTFAKREHFLTIEPSLPKKFVQQRTEKEKGRGMMPNGRRASRVDHEEIGDLITALRGRSS